MEEIYDIILDTEFKFTSKVTFEPWVIYRLLENDIEIFNVNTKFKNRFIELIGKYYKTDRRK